AGWRSWKRRRKQRSSTCLEPWARTHCGLAEGGAAAAGASSRSFEVSCPTRAPLLTFSDLSWRIMQTDRVEPTPEMVAFFERRPTEHIGAGRRCLALLAPVMACGEELLERGRVHDASKFGPEERIPYVWLTEYHRRRRAGEPFAYPEGMAERVKLAI